MPLRLRFIAFGIALVFATICCPDAFSRKMKLKLEPTPSDTITPMTEGSLTICSPCVPCNEGYSIDQAKITGFDKKADATKESFFITNTTDRRLVGMDFTITYLTSGNKQLHSRHVDIDCDIPPGETRKFDIKSFDTQKSFYYHKSQAPLRKQASPFKISIQIGCLRLK